MDSASRLLVTRTKSRTGAAGCECTPIGFSQQPLQYATKAHNNALCAVVCFLNEASQPLLSYAYIEHTRPANDGAVTNCLHLFCSEKDLDEVLQTTSVFLNVSKVLRWVWEV